MHESFSTRSLDFVIALALLLGITMLVARRRSIMMRVPARLESIRHVMTTFSDFANQASLSEQAIYQCQLAIDEACANIIKHAYANDTSGEIQVVFHVDPDGCIISLTDFGKSYNPKYVPSPRAGNSLEDVRPGGLGLFLINAVMDQVQYTPGPHGNRLVMIKRRG